MGAFAWRHWLNRLTRPNRRPDQGRSLRPEVEQLEDRAVPSATVPAAALMRPTYQEFPSPTGTALSSPLLAPAGLTPAQVRGAYGFDKIVFPGNVAADGTGETIALVDAFDDPTAASDLIAFDRQFALPDPAFVKVGINAQGTASSTSFPSPDPDWSVEIALDVEWAHAIAPKARILLVEANSNSYADLLRAVDYARNFPGVAAVSMSWGGSEISSETSFDSHFTTPAGHSGVTFFASSGDSGAPALAPAVSSHVVAVGGTTLTLDAAGDWIDESAWSGGGGGLSTYISQPTYQHGLTIFGADADGRRAAPDVSYDADPTTGVAVLATYGYGGWVQVGGTSDAAPQWAALVTLADQGRALVGKPALDGFTQTLPDLYKLPASDFHDVTTGDNGYPAGPGYDLATGLGTPIANFIVPDLIGVPQVMTAIAVTPASTLVGDGNQLQLSAVALDQYGTPMDVQPSFGWSLVNGLGTITDSGLYLAPSAGVGTDTVTVSATVNNVTITGTATLSFQPGPSVTQLGADPSQVTGVSTTLSAQVSDLNPGTLTYFWWVVSEPAGAMVPTLTTPGNVSTTATFYQAGTYQFGFGVTDGAGVSASGFVNVTVVPTFTSIGLSPVTVTLGNGAQQRFAATALDQFGNALAAQPTFTWSVVSGLGTIDPNGVYTAPSSGSGSDIVGASAIVSGVGASGTAVVTYVPGFEVTAISANPGVVTGTTTTVSATAANPGGGDVFYFWWVWSAPDGVGGPMFDDPGAATTTATFFEPGDYTLMVLAYNLSGGSATATVDVTVVPTVTSVVVSPLVVDVPVGGRQQFAAQALDQFYNPMPATFTWSVARGLGTVDATGLYTAPAAGYGNVYVQASTTVDGVSVSGQGFPILLQPPSITAISASSNPLTAAKLSVAAYDPNGGGILSFRWSAVVVPAGAKTPTLSAAGAWTTNATFFQAGAYKFRVAVTNAAGLTTLADLNVMVDPVLTSVVMTPARATVPDGLVQQFTAGAFDQFHQPIAAAFAWSMAGGSGSVNGDTGLYTAPSSGGGTAVVKASATANGVTLSHTAAVTLLPPPAIASVGAGPNPVTGTTTTLRVVASNPGGGSLTYLWKAMSGPSGAPLPTIRSAGAATTIATFFQAGSYTFQVTVTNQRGSAMVATVNVTVKSVLTFVVLTPATTTVQGGAQQQFSVSALDQFHQVMTAQAVAWSVSGPGSIDSGGLYQAPAVIKGVAVIKARVVVNRLTLIGSATVGVV